MRFRRPAGTLPLPVPERGGSIEALQPFLNLASRDDFVLVVVWVLAALRSNRTIWTGTASDLLLLCSEGAREANSSGSNWAKKPQALAGRLRRAQTFLRTLGIEITFSRERRTRSRMIRVSTRTEDCVSSVSLIGTAGGNGSRCDQTARSVSPLSADATDRADGQRQLVCVSRKGVPTPCILFS
jgi:hypothetical protein